MCGHGIRGAAVLGLGLLLLLLQQCVTVPALEETWPNMYIKVNAPCISTPFLSKDLRFLLLNILFHCSSYSHFLYKYYYFVMTYFIIRDTL